MFLPSDLAGCMPALITPMIPDSKEYSGFAVDYEGAARHAKRVVELGVAGVVIAGTTGQAPTLTNDEHVELARQVAGAVREAMAETGRRGVKIIVSAGSNDTASALRMVERVAEAADPDAYLHVTGYYNNPPQEGLLNHFAMVADFSARFGKPTVLYNVPSRTNSFIEADTLIELARHPNIVGVKEACGDLRHVRRVLENTDRETFAVVSGEDGQVADIMAMGGVGVISAAANVWPAEFQRLTELAAEGEFDKAEELQRALGPCVDATFCAKNPIPLHYMLETEVRPPLLSLGKLREPKRSSAIAKIEKARAILSFPHCHAMSAL
jgi:4-hydroxy-tetrahydrodipicolinate synthase